MTSLMKNENKLTQDENFLYDGHDFFPCVWTWHLAQSEVDKKISSSTIKNTHHFYFTSQ